MRSLKLAALAALAMTVSACATTLKAGELTEEGRFDTNTLLPENGVEINAPFKPEYGQMVYVIIDEELADYSDFFVQNFENMDVFEQVMTRSEMEDLVFERQLMDRVSNVSDRVGWYGLSQEIGPFLVVRPATVWEGGYDFMASLTVTDPSTGEQIVVLRNSAFNWSGLDQPLFYPLLNGFLDWAQDIEIETREASPSLEDDDEN